MKRLDLVTRKGGSNRLCGLTETTKIRPQWHLPISATQTAHWNQDRTYRPILRPPIIECRAPTLHSHTPYSSSPSFHLSFYSRW
jgi:hypothetical protein